MITNFLTPITTQSYMPIIPLLLTEDYDEPIRRVGQIFFVMAFGSFLSFMLMHPLLSRFATKSVLKCDFAVRSVAGLIWVYALWDSIKASEPYSAAPRPGLLGTVPLLFLSRFLFGLTLNSFALSAPRAGGRVKHDDKPAALAQLQAAIGLGICLLYTSPSPRDS